MAHLELTNGANKVAHLELTNGVNKVAHLELTNGANKVAHLELAKWQGGLPYSSFQVLGTFMNNY